jgi:hypothetical protein
VDSAAAGGGLHVLVGNHEVMSAQGNARYATDGAMHKFAKWARICQHKGVLPPGVAKQNHCQLYTQPGPLACPEGDAACAQQLERMAPYVRPYVPYNILKPDAPRPSPRTDRTRRVSPPVLKGHVASACRRFLALRAGGPIARDVLAPQVAPPSPLD